MSAVLHMIKEIKYSNTNGCPFRHTAGNMTRTPWGTNRYTQAPTVPMPMPLSVDDSTPEGPPWASLPSTSASIEDAQQLRSTGNLLHQIGRAHV